MSATLPPSRHNGTAATNDPLPFLKAIEVQLFHMLYEADNAAQFAGYPFPAAERAREILIQAGGEISELMEEFQPKEDAGDEAA